jgi:thioredoxin-like negative regulator of GroEL
LLGEGKFAEAEKHFSSMIKRGDLIGDLLPMCLLLLAQCYVKQAKLTNYEETISKVKTDYRKEIESKTPDTDLFREFIADLDKQYNEIKAAPLKDDKLVNLKKQVEASPTDLELKYQLAQIYSEK